MKPVAKDKPQTVICNKPDQTTFILVGDGRDTSGSSRIGTFQGLHFEPGARWGGFEYPSWKNGKTPVNIDRFSQQLWRGSFQGLVNG